MTFHFMCHLSSLHRRFIAFVACAAVSFQFAPSPGAAPITSPADFVGHPIGADYQLARWEKIVDYFRQLDTQSDRVRVRELGQTTEGLPMILAEISDAGTMRNPALHQSHQRKLSDPRLLETLAEEQRIIAESKVVLLVNCNLHSSETASSQMAMELAYELAATDTPRVREILAHTIVLLVPSANPDGLNKVIDWYEGTLGKPWEGSGMPWLYQKYAGHDNNRDWFMLSLQETRLLTRVLYEEWFPTIVYDVHQMGNRSARFFVPPFHDPKNPNVHPLIDQSLLLIGGHMAAELAGHDKKGVVHGAMYDNWWAGGFRTTPYRHNMVGILTEAASPRIATPVFQEKSELRGARGLPDYTMTTAFPEPWPGGWWRLRDVVDYERLACLSLFTLAARYHEMFQGNYLRIAREAIELGKNEPPFAWLVPPGQRDPGSAMKMLRILRATGIEMHLAETPFTADGVEYPSGTYLLYTAQPFRAHLNDMMERQEYPDRAQFPGGPAEQPYDIAGWTLPLQMGVRHVPVAQPFEANARKLEQVDLASAEIHGPNDASAYRIEIGRNADFRLINRLHRSGLELSIRPSSLGRAVVKSFPPGTVVIRNGEAFRSQLQTLTDGLSVRLAGIPALDDAIESSLVRLAEPRTALYQPWTASMDEGWTRYVLDEFEFSYRTLHNAEIRAANLRDRYDCVILPSATPKSIIDGRAPDTTEPAYVGGIGPEGVVSLQSFVREGGTLVCIDASCNLPIEYFNIPVTNIVRGLNSKDFFCPGSLLRISVTPDHPLSYGLPDWVSGYFTQSQAFELLEARDKGRESRHPANRYPASTVARYGDTVLLESGWIRGADRIADQPAIVEVKFGNGRIVLFGFRVQHRAQPHGSFRFLFNAIQRSTIAG